MIINKLFYLVGLTISVTLGFTNVFAQKPTYPSQPIKLIVPFAPGGSNDVVARIIAPKASEILGVPVIVENRAGGGGSVGASLVSKASPDGYTILLHSITVTMQPWLLKDPGYNLFKDFEPITQLTNTPFTLVASVATGVTTYKQLVEYAKNKKEGIFFGSAGTGSSPHLVGEYFKNLTSINLNHVPYKGNSPMMTALMANEIQVGFDTIHSSKPMSDSGRVKILAITSLDRNENLPNIPTLNESGVPGFDVGVWQGIFLPKGVSAAIVKKIHNSFTEALKDPQVIQKLKSNGFDVIGSSPSDFLKKIQTDMDLWSKVTKQIGIKPE